MTVETASPGEQNPELESAEAGAIYALELVLKIQQFDPRSADFKERATRLAALLARMEPEPLALVMQVRDGLPRDPALERVLARFTLGHAPQEYFNAKRLLSTSPDKLLARIGYLRDRKRNDVVRNSPELSQLIDSFRSRIPLLNLFRLGRNPSIGPDSEAWEEEAKKMALAQHAVERSESWASNPPRKKLALAALETSSSQWGVTYW